MGKLNNRQELFVNEYLKTFNATKAAIAAKYSATSARTQGPRLLQNADVSARIQERLKEAAMQADEVLFHLSEIARTDMRELVDAKGRPNIKAAEVNGKTRLIKKIRMVSTDSGTETEIETHDRLRALELIGKHHRLFTDKQELSTEDGKPIPVLITGMDMNEL